MTHAHREIYMRVSKADGKMNGQPDVYSLLISMVRVELRIGHEDDCVI